MGTSPYARIDSKKSLVENAYEALKEAICSNAVSPGDVLSENQIAKELGMSRTPVREALRMLAAEDYIEVRNGTGIFIKPISQADWRSLMHVRKSLEILAAETAIHQIPDRDIDALERVFNGLLEDYKNKKNMGAREFTAVDYQLHELLVERCGNKYVKNIMNGIHANIKRFQSVSFTTLNNLPESTQQHLHLLQLIRVRDSAGLAKALAEHIDWALDCIVF